MSTNRHWPKNLAPAAEDRELDGLLDQYERAVRDGEREDGGFGPEPASVRGAIMRYCSELAAARDESRKRLHMVYEHANTVLRAAPGDIADWIDAVEHMGLIAADDKN